MIYSFIVDNNPKFHLQAYYLLVTLLKLGNVPRDQIVVHYAGEIPDTFKKIIHERFSLEIRKVEQLVHPYCNKIQQLGTLTDSNEDVVLLDCDTVITRPVPWPEIEAVAAKRVDTATPPESIMQKLFNSAGLPIEWAQSDCLPGHEGTKTPRHNYNGGVYFIKKKNIPQLYASWKKWATFCIDNQQLFGNYAMHVDQVAFALSITELGMPVHTLPREFNFPTHLSLPANFDGDPYILHYHWMLDDQQLLKATGHPHVDSRIALVNNCITTDRKSSFSNNLFWDFRYASDAARGSGVGSRGVVLGVKTNLLQRLINAGSYNVVLDIGCGDIETTRKLSGSFTYLGIDASPEALKLAKEKRPDWNFMEYSQFAQEANGELCNLALCLDVLIHQPSKADYDALVELMCSVTNDTLVVAAYDEMPAFTSSLTYFYEPVTTSLRKTGHFQELFTVGRYRDVSVVVAKKRTGIKHLRDISADHVNDVVGWTRSPLVFRELLDFSRSAIGFFPNHTPRAIEYTWIVNELSAMPEKPSVIDVGAGVSCLPLFLARRGLEVITVDYSPHLRTIADRATWNEWGFLDYSLLNPRIRSINTPFETAAIATRVDALYSVSVIEHLTTSARKRWLTHMKELLKPTGRILLTVDLIPPTDDLWIFAEGKLVEPNHGTCRTLLDEIRAEGFIVDYLQIVQAIPGTRVDIAMIAARLP